MAENISQKSVLPVFVAAGLVALLTFTSGGGQDSATRLRSRVMTWDEARSHVANWGEMRTFFTGETFGTTNLLCAAAVVKPGESVHPAHRHAEEEFLVLTEGTGRWHLAGREFAAKRGDVLYVEPWVFHGLVNTGTGPLTFFVVRWNSQGVKLPPVPPGEHGK